MIIRIARHTSQEIRALGDLHRGEPVPGRWDSRGNFHTGEIVENEAVVRWTRNGLKCRKFWKGWLPTYKWDYVDGEIKQFSKQNVVELLQLLPNAPNPIGEFSFCFGPMNDGDNSELLAKGRYTERLYAVYQATDGDYYLAKGNADFTGWDSYERLVFVPSGAYHPNICFDEGGHFTVAAEFQPAGGEIELWIYEYPYTGEGIREIVSGIYCRTPVMFLDLDLDLLFFYGNSTNIRYRVKSENYAIEHTLPVVSSKHIGIEAIKWFNSGGIFNYIIVTYNFEGESFIRYIITQGFGKVFLSEFSGGSFGCSGITWESVVNFDQFPEEFADSILGLTEITWERVLVFTQSPAEFGASTVNLRTITWVQITFVNTSKAESGNAQTGLVSILWIQP